MRFFNKVVTLVPLLASLFAAGCDRTVTELPLNKTAYNTVTAIAQSPMVGEVVSNESQPVIPNRTTLKSEKTELLIASSKARERTLVQSVNSKAGCAKALELVNTCAYESKCDSDITSNLPSEPRSHFNVLIQESWFRGEQFSKYCVDACRTKSTKVDTDAFKFEVCGYSDDLSASKGYKPIVKALNIENKIQAQTQGIEFKVISNKFGKSLSSKSTPYGCDSAFRERNTQLQEYSSFSIETNYNVAVIRSIEMNGVNSLLLTNGKIITAVSEQQFNSAYSSQAVKLDAHVYRSAATKDSGLESAYDFYFKDGKLMKVMYWIAC